MNGTSENYAPSLTPIYGKSNSDSNRETPLDNYEKVK
jgi:hypothetical protein